MTAVHAHNKRARKRRIQWRQKTRTSLFTRGEEEWDLWDIFNCQQWWSTVAFLSGLRVSAVDIEKQVREGEGAAGSKRRVEQGEKSSFCHVRGIWKRSGGRQTGPPVNCLHHTQPTSCLSALQRGTMRKTQTWDTLRQSRRAHMHRLHKYTEIKRNTHIYRSPVALGSLPIWSRTGNEHTGQIWSELQLPSHFSLSFSKKYLTATLCPKRPVTQISVFINVKENTEF